MNNYILKHGYGPGTLPKDVEVLKYGEDDYYCYVTLNRSLTDEELKYYDIRLDDRPEERRN